MKHKLKSSQNEEARKKWKKLITMAHNFCLEMNGKQQNEDEIKYTEFWSPNSMF